MSTNIKTANARLFLSREPAMFTFWTFVRSRPRAWNWYRIILRESGNNILRPVSTFPNKFRHFMLHSTMPAETCFAAPLHISFSEKFQRLMAASELHGYRATYGNLWHAPFIPRFQYGVQQRLFLIECDLVMCHRDKMPSYHQYIKREQH